MQKIEKIERQMWQEVVENLSLKNSRGYDDGVKIIVDLKEYYEYKKIENIFIDNMEVLVFGKFGKSVALKRRLKNAGVIK
jgi:hypothetical protein